MKHWFSRDSVKAKIGFAAIVLLALTGITAGSHHSPRQFTEVRQTGVVSSAPADVVDVSEKPKISVTETKVETTDEAIPFATTQTYDGTLPKDTQVVRVEGVNGKKVVRTEVKTKDGLEVSRALISEDVTVPPVSKVVAIGTKIVPKSQKETGNGSCDPHYTPCVKKVSYDLDCKDIGYRVHVVAIGEDPYGFDRDDDGIGCENYPEL